MTIRRALFGDHRDPSEELEEIFGSRAGSTAAVAEAKSWGSAVLEAAGVAPRAQVAAVAALRKAEPRLALRPATYLAQLLAG